ncbi:hypothetical protein JXL83_03355 [candidate division WOR-3 bacterium]|nr:hypothetical protein [candidate division WOR-3 bacterium]
MIRISSVFVIPASLIFLCLSCTQPADPSYKGPVIESVSGRHVFILSEPCSLKIYVSDEKHSSIEIRSITGEDTSQWMNSFPSNQDFYMELNQPDTGFNSVTLQARNPDEMTSSWSDPFIFFAAADSLYFYDDFNTQDTFLDTSVWTFGTSGNAVIKIGDCDQRRAVLFYDPLIGSSWITAYAYIPLADSGSISFSVFIPSSASADESNLLSFRTFPYNWDWPSRGMHFGIVSDSLCYKYGTTWNKLASIPRGQWNDISVVYSSMSKKYSFLINQTQLNVPIDFDGSGTDNILFQILCPDNAFRDSIWLDDLSFRLL